eukprot:4550290-Amphidinium_carterae.1
MRGSGVLNSQVALNYGYEEPRKPKPKCSCHLKSGLPRHVPFLLGTESNSGVGFVSKGVLDMSLSDFLTHCNLRKGIHIFKMVWQCNELLPIAFLLGSCRVTALVSL